MNFVNCLDFPIACFQAACVIHSAFIDGEKNCMYLGTGPNSTEASRDQLKASFLLGENFFDLMFNFSARLNSFQLAPVETAIFTALMLIQPGKPCVSPFLLWSLHFQGHVLADRQGLKLREEVNALQESIIRSLHSQISQNHPEDAAGLFPRLLMLISNLRELSVEHRRMLSSLKTSHPGATFDLFGLVE